MTKTEDRLSLSFANWIALIALCLMPLMALIAAWCDIKTDAAVTRTKIDQLSKDFDHLSKDFAELKATLNDRRLAALLSYQEPTLLKAPFPYFGGKSLIASEIWSRFGTVSNYVEPFCGSAATLLARPGPFPECETINDACGFIANFWRSTKNAPDAVARHADWPVNENDHHARHAWLVTQVEDLRERLEGDPHFYDPQVAGFWLCGISSAIGRYGLGDGPWQSIDGKLTKVDRKCDPRGQGISRQIPKAGWNGIHARGPKSESFHGCCDRWETHLKATMQTLSDRLRRVRVCSGDWQRVLTPSFTTTRSKTGITAVFVDPPYAVETKCDQNLYRVNDGCVSHDVRRWAIEHGDDARFRICLAGYEGEHDLPPTWNCVAWSASGGYSKPSRTNRHRERLWFSPHCLAGNA